MNRQAVKDHHIACMNVPANSTPAADSGIARHLRHMKILIQHDFEIRIDVTLSGMRKKCPTSAGQSWSGNSCSKVTWISSHESVILMCVNCQSFAVRKVMRRRPIGFGWINSSISHDHFHRTLERWVMRQGMKRSEIEYLLISPGFEHGVGIAACCADLLATRSSGSCPGAEASPQN